MSEKNKGGRPRKFSNAVRRSVMFEQHLLDAVRLVARAEVCAEQTIIQKAVQEYVERNYPQALQPGARITETITAPNK